MAAFDNCDHSMCSLGAYWMHSVPGSVPGSVLAVECIETGQILSWL